MCGDGRKTDFGYLTAILATAAVVLLRRVIFGDLLGRDAPLYLFLFAVMAAGWHGGLKPGLLATALGTLAGIYLFIGRNGWSVGLAGDRLRIALFVGAGVLVSWFCEAMHRSRDRSDREREALRVTLASIGDAVLTTDAEGRVTLLNPVAAALTGWIQDEAVGRPLEEVVRIVDEQTHQAIANPVGRVLGEGRIIELGNHTLLIARDGTERPIDDSAAPLRDAEGALRAIVLTFRDVTERRRAEEALRLSEARLAADLVERTRTNEALRKQAGRQRLLWEAAAVLMTTADADAMLRTLFAKIGPDLGLDAYFNFMVNDTGDALRLVSCMGIPEQTARSIERLEFGQAVCGAVAQSRQPIVATHIQQSDDPRVQLVKSFGIRVYACNPLLAGDRLLGSLSFASRSRDQLDADEVEFLQTICRYVAVAYERLRLVEQLKEADRKKDEFLATLAHELRNPLAPLRNGLQILRLTGEDREATENACLVMERQVKQLVRLVDDLLDVSRITRNKLKLRKERMELAVAVRQAVEISRPLIEAASHHLTVTLPAEPIPLDADAARLAQVFSNLLNNAAKYTERGGRIWLTVERQGSEAVVRVKDTGIGIPADSLPHLFEMFTQIDRSLERSQGGLGIGLTLVKRLTEMHGGTVEVHSDGPDRGSEFTVRLPVANVRPAAPQEPNSAGDRTAASRQLKILVVDDNVDSATSLSMMLRIHGHDVRTAHDGVQAVEMAEAFRPDAVLLDIGLPKRNGYEAARCIRQQPWGKPMRLIALTGWGQEEDRRRSKEAGFDRHLVKPVDPAVLETLLVELCAVTA